MTIYTASGAKLSQGDIVRGVPIGVLLTVRRAAMVRGKKLLLDEKELVSLYLTKNLDQRQLGERYGCSQSSVGRILKRHKVAGFFKHMRKYNVDETFFDIIDTEEKAYWLGFLCADGYINTGRGFVTLTLSTRDREHLNSYKKALKYEGVIYDEVSKYCRSTIRISSRPLSKSLSDKGVVQAKSLILKPPTQYVPKDLLRHFWRGMVDGDGYIGHKKGVLELIGTEDVVRAFKEFCKDFSSADPTPYHRTNPKTWSIMYCGNLSVAAIVTELYRDSKVFLDRKQKRAEAVVLRSKHVRVYSHNRDESGRFSPKSSDHRGAKAT